MAADDVEGDLEVAVRRLGHGCLGFNRSASRRLLRGKPVVDAVGRNGGGTLPNLQ